MLEALRWCIGCLFAATVLCAFVSGLSRVMTRRYEARRYQEVAGFSPPAALMMLYGRAWAYAHVAVIVSGLAFVVVLLVSAAV